MYLTSTTGDITATINGAVTGAIDGVILDARFAPDGGNVAVSGTGSITGQGTFGLWMLADTGTIAADGFSAINGDDYGIRVDSNGTYAGTNPGGDVKLGMTARLGAVTATAGVGIEVIQLANPAGDGHIDIKASSIDALGYGIHTLGWTGNTLIEVQSVESGATGIYATSTTGNITISGGGNGTIDAGDEGITADARFAPQGGDVTISGFSSIEAADEGVFALADIGTVTIDDIGSIAAVGHGIWVETTGAVNIGQGTAIGPITAQIEKGIAVIQAFDAANNGEIKVKATSLTSGGFGIHTLAWQEDTTTVTTGVVKATGATGIYGTATTGDVSVSGGGTGSVDGGDEGITIDTAGGNATVQNFASVTGTDAGIWLLPDSGTASVQGVGSITGKGSFGILATGTGAIEIGNVAANGPITGKTTGIDATTAASGDVVITTNANVTGANAFGIRTVSGGKTTIDIVSGAVTGTSPGTTGLNSLTTGAGDTNINVAAGSIVSGGNWGMVVDKDGGGTGTVNNAGKITTNGEDVGSTGDHWAFSAYTGTTTLNNSGSVIGRVWSEDGSKFTFNNSGLYEASRGEHVYGSEDVLSNTGTTRLGAGVTSFRALGELNNQAGGIIDIAARSAAATDSLVTTGTFAPKAGSVLVLNFDANAANNTGLGFDDTDDGKGTADTIVSTVAKPQSKSTIKLVSTGTPQSLTGSVALVYTGKNLTAPKAETTLADSKFYTLSGGPEAGKVAFALVDDGQGGVYLQWVPNTSAKALGGYGGATGTGEAAGHNRPAQAVASAARAFNGIGGFGSGPVGGGAAAHVADLAAGINPAQDRSGRPGCPSQGNGTAWGQGEASRARFGGGHEGSAESLSGGVDANLVTTEDCSALAIGLFGAAGWSETDLATGSVSTDSTGVGVYIRAASVAGLYGSLLGAYSWADQELTNSVIGSHASRDAGGFTGVATLGLLTRLAEAAALDLRGFVAYGRLDGDGFQDSVGFVVTGSEDDLLTLGASAGVHVVLADGAHGFVRGGVKWAQLDSSITAFGVTQSGDADEVSGAVEVGLAMSASAGVQLGISGFGEFSESATGYGGRASLDIKF